MVDGLAIEAPVATDLESRNAFLSEEAVDGRGMDAEIIRELSHRHYRTSHRRPASSRAPPLSSTLRHNIIEPPVYVPRFGLDGVEGGGRVPSRSQKSTRRWRA